ncbi:MAG: hypothetical protein RJB11_2328 [Planctomycetota bacterium]|jgi:hypothetical protein
MNDTLQILTGRIAGPLAHAGHGQVDANHPLHYLTTPEHFLGVLVIIACVVCATWFISRLIYRISNPT